MKKSRRSVWRALSMIIQFSINMLVPILLCSFLGLWIHRTWGIEAEIPLFFLGAMAGFRNIYIMARSIYGDNKGTGRKE